MQSVIGSCVANDDIELCHMGNLYGHLNNDNVKLCYRLYYSTQKINTRYGIVVLRYVNSDERTTLNG